MALKILVAGVDKDERSAAEATVKHALGWRALSETWTISLVRMGAMWSVTLDGPDERFRGISFVTGADRLGSTIAETIESKGGGSAPPAEEPPSLAPVPEPPPEPEPAPEPMSRIESPAPTAPTPPVAPPTPDAAPHPVAEPATPPAVRRPTQPVEPKPTPARAPAPQAPATGSPSMEPGEHRDDHGCEHCQGPFVVVYEMQPNDSLQLVPVACPHCWKINLIEVGAWAASGRDYRANKV